MRKKICLLILIPFVLLLMAGVVQATITISGISPDDGARHIDITNNPPNPNGYIPITWTLTDNTGGGDMQFYMDVYLNENETWENHRHYLNQDSGTWNQDEDIFNETATNYKWRIRAFDDTDDTWNNQTFVFRTDDYPEKASNPSPIGNVTAGKKTLSVEVNHPDNDAGGKIYNVTFHRYYNNNTYNEPPENTIIGYNSSISGYDNGTIVRCNTDFNAKYNDTNYSWYVICYDDEYNTTSNIWTMKTYYNDTEPEKVYNALSSKVYVEEYTDTEPETQKIALSAKIFVDYDTYSVSEPEELPYILGGGEVNVFFNPMFRFPYPYNTASDRSIHPNMGLWFYKSGEKRTWDVNFYANDTVDGSWHEVEYEKQILLGFGANNLTINDTFDQGTYTNTVIEDEKNLTLDYFKLNIFNDDFEDGDYAGKWIKHEVTNDSDTGITTENCIDSYGLRVDANDWFESTYFNLTGYDEVYLSAYMEGWSMDNSGEHALLQFYDGANWITLESMGEYDDRTSGWVNSSLPSDNFSVVNKLRLIIDGDNGGGDHAALDEVRVYYRYYDEEGERVSPKYSLNGRAKDNGKINWSEETPLFTKITVSYRISTNNGVSWSSWSEISNNSGISEISDGDILDSYMLQFKQVLNTTNRLFTPKLWDFTFSIDRYTYVEKPFSGLQYETTYNWYAKASYQTSVINSSVYYFSTGSFEFSTEPDYSVEKMMGGIVRAETMVHVTEYPLSGKTNVSIYTPLLKVDLNSTDEKNIEVTFQQNDSGEWKDMPPDFDIKTNKTLEKYHYVLQPFSTHEWRVKIYNETTDKTHYSDSFFFTTGDRVLGSVNKVYNALSGVIFLEDYDGSEPDTAYYAQGGEIEIGQPGSDEPYPPHQSKFGHPSKFGCRVMDIDGDILNVSFHYANNDTIWATVYNIPSGSRAETTKTPSMTNSTPFEWYVTIDDGSWTNQSQTWIYTPQNQKPNVTIKPEDGNDFVQVTRQIKSGEWKRFVQLEVNVTDMEKDTISIDIYVDNPSIGNWNDWELRLSHESDDFSYYNNTLYIQDEIEFNEVNTEYHWKVEVEDEYGAKTVSYSNFTTAFLFWSYYEWTPSNPTTEDVTILDKSENATHMKWLINGEVFAEAQFDSGDHEPFNIENIPISSIYNISLWVYNETCNQSHEFHAESLGSHGLLYLDRNVTFKKSMQGAGYNYFVYQENQTILPSEFADYYAIPDGWWIWKYSDGEWNEYWAGYSDDGFIIEPWDVLIVKANADLKIRRDIVEPVPLNQNIHLENGYNYIGYSNLNGTSAYNLTFVDTGEHVWKYDTINNTWMTYWVGYSGDDFIVKGNTPLILLTAERDIQIGGIT